MVLVRLLAIFTIVSPVFSAVLHEEMTVSPNEISSRGIDAKGILTSLAGSLMSRGFVPTAAGSQIVSLNLTNLLVLVLLKALIFAAGSLGTGTWKGGLARSNDGEEKFITEDEILLYLSYLTGDGQDYGCLQNVACREPEQARKYVLAGDTLLQTGQMFGFDIDRHYQNVLQEVQEAVDVGGKSGDCGRFICSNESH